MVSIEPLWKTTWGGRVDDEGGGMDGEGSGKAVGVCGRGVGASRVTGGRAVSEGSGGSVLQATGRKASTSAKAILLPSRRRSVSPLIVFPSLYPVSGAQG